MRYPLFVELVLSRDVPEDGLKAGDLVRVVDRNEIAGDEDGYSIEVFSATGKTIAVTVVPKSAIAPVRADHVLCVRARE